MKHLQWVTALVLGIAVGALVAQPPVSVQRTIDLDGVASLIVGLALFLGLNLLYQQRSAVASGEKAILIKLANDALDASQGLDTTFGRVHKENPISQGSQEDIYSGLQRYNNAVHTLERSVERCKLAKSKLDLAAILRNREEYRAVLTETPFPIKYDPESYRRQQGHQLAVSEAFVDFILALNRL
jgi:hypothetical protein